MGPLSKSYIYFTMIAVSLTACTNDETETVSQMEPARIILNGKQIDTAYLFSTYKDPGASFFEDRDGTKNCNEYGIVSNVTGSVNPDLPGTYYLTYNAQDLAGNPMTPVTRTIIVVENPANFLNGLYNVACTCTALASSSDPIITSQNYTALVNPGSARNQFELVSLEVGGEKVIPRSSLNGYRIDVGFFNANFDWSCSGGTGTLSPGKNSFTIETQAQRYTPSIKYFCKNVYTKLLTIKNAKPDPGK
jgi:hypothetical protein